VSTNSIDTGAVSRDIARGEVVGFGLSIGASSLTTLLVELISATDAALTAGILVHATRTFLAADVPAAARHFVPLNPGTPTQRYLGVRVTPIGGAATVTLDCWYTPKSMFGIPPKNVPLTYVP
jgi:hypothetical protein